jgi:hypothetical protein
MTVLRTNISDSVYTEHRSREDGLPESAILRRRASDSSFAEFLVGDFKSDVGSSEGGTGETELLLEDGRVGVDFAVLGVDFDTLDGGNGASSFGENSRFREFLDDGRKELMGYTEDDESGSLDDFGERRDGDEVFGESHLGKVTSVLVSLVDDIGEETLSRDL